MWIVGIDYGMIGDVECKLFAISYYYAGIVSNFYLSSIGR